MNMSVGTIHMNEIPSVNIQEPMVSIVPSYITSGGTPYCSISSVANGSAPNIIMAVNGVVITEEELLQQFTYKNVNEENKEFYIRIWKRNIEEELQNERDKRNPRRINYEDFNFNSSSGIAIV